jgi:hypothetical protein
MNDLMEKLQEAKKNVIWLIEHADGLVDFHDLVYWAFEVERLRIEIKNIL